MMILTILVVLLLSIQYNYIFQQRLRLILYKHKRTWKWFSCCIFCIVFGKIFSFVTWYKLAKFHYSIKFISFYT